MLTADKFASMNILYSHYSLDRFLSDSERLGYKNIELWGAVPHYSYDYPDQKKQCDSIKSKIKEHNLNLICFTPEQCIYPFNIASDDSYVREQSVKYFSRCIEDTILLDCDMMLITPGWGNFDESREDAWNRSIDSMGELLKKAETEGVKLAYEILLPSESNLVTDLKSLTEMMVNFDSPNMVCCVDTVPMAFAKESLSEYFDALGSKIKHIHLNDGRPTGHMAWGDGTQDLTAHLNSLTENNYEGFVTFETCDDSYIFEPHKAFEKNLQTISSNI